MPACLSEVILAKQGLISAYGTGVSRCAEGLLAGQCAYQAYEGPSGSSELNKLPAGLIPVLDRVGSSRLSFDGLLDQLFEGVDIPQDAALYIATTVGAIDLLEASVMEDNGAPPTENLSAIPARLARRLGLDPERAQVVSSACTSSTAALAVASSSIRRGEIDCAIVVGADLVSEFVLSGFLSLMAIDPDGSRPFAADRKGLTLGEAAGFALLMSRSRAEQDKQPCLGFITGWGLTCDANHLTGPSRDGLPLSEAIRTALKMTNCSTDRVAAICAHGSGTVYSDQMEMKAFKHCFGESPVPVFSTKGGMGHVLGAAGLAETLLSLEFLRRGEIPATIGLGPVSEEASGWVSPVPQTIDSSNVLVTTNSGFGGVNAALTLSLSSAPTNQEQAKPPGEYIRTEEKLITREEADQSGLTHSFGKAKRISAESYLACRAVDLALSEAGLDLSSSLRIGIVACGVKGSDVANYRYFNDYIQSGRKLGRAQLFVYTLPTSVAAACAIGHQLTGPLMYVRGPGHDEASAYQDACGLLADGLADAMVIVRSTAQRSSASVVTAV